MPRALLATRLSSAGSIVDLPLCLRHPRGAAPPLPPALLHRHGSR